MKLSIILGASILLSAIFLVKFIKSKKSFAAKAEAQSIYDNSKKKSRARAISGDEKLELSWKFLYDITEMVVNKFSKKDKDETHEAGKKLAENGASYEHIIDLGIRRERKAASVNKAQEGSGRNL